MTDVDRHPGDWHAMSEHPTEAEWEDMTLPDGRYDEAKLMTWIRRKNRRRAKELSAAWGISAPLYFPWHDGTEKFGE